MKNVNDKFLVFSVFLFLLALLAVRASAGNYEFKGVYPVQSVLLSYCDSCFLELPPDFLKSEIVLSVNTDDEKQFIQAVKVSSLAIGWDFQRRKNGVLRAEPLQNIGNMIYISCMDRQPHNVPNYLYSASVKADLIQCRERDSLQNLARERAKNDSIRLDSLQRVKLDFANYRLRYYAYSKSFVDRLGVDWGATLASGDLRGKLQLFDDWRLVATQTNDTTFTTRSVEFSVDTTLSLDWGSEEQTLKNSYLKDGFVTQDYEWRKYGLLIVVKRDGKRVKLDYVFRDKDNSISVLQGSVIGQEGDTLRLVGEYTVNRSVQTGVPFISSVPILGELFKSNQTQLDNRAFELYLLPGKNK